MATRQEYALLSLYVYNAKDKVNRPDLTGWLELEYHPDNIFGFSYGIFQNITTREVVIAYTGSNEWLIADFLAANVPAGAGQGSIQVWEAALAYQRAKEAYGDNITLTGHSLGGGLASIIAVWFNREAVIFDAAPFELTARNLKYISTIRTGLAALGYRDPAFTAYDPIANFLTRELAVTGFFLQGEFLASLRAPLLSVQGNSDSAAVVRAGINDPSLSDGITLHSQALLTASLMSEAFRASTELSLRVLPRVMDKRLYASDASSSSERNFLIDLIRSEQRSGGNGKLTHFAADLNKIGTNAAGLNHAAQDVLIAQSIEWYYWQGSDYTGHEEFITVNGSLLQYTTAQGTALADAENRAAAFVEQWLAPIANDHGEFYLPIFGSRYQQFNVAAGSTGSTGSALNPGKTQLFVGQGGSDVFFGGDLGDVFFGGPGSDSLYGGGGNDFLYGGTGTDVYTFSSAFGHDTVNDEGGAGSIVVTGLPPIDGVGAAKSNLAASTWRNSDGKITYTLVNLGTAGAPRSDLVIDVASDATVGRITVRNWVNGQLGINLGNDLATRVIAQTRVGDFVKASNSGEYKTAGNNYVPDGSQLNAPDVLNGSVANDLLQGLGGNDGIAGGAGDDVIEGGTGDDLLLGGNGADTIRGGDGDDQIIGSSGAGLIDRPTSTSFTPPAATGRVLARGFSWVVYDPPGEGPYLIAGTTGIGPDAESTGNLIEAGAGNDRVAAGTGADIAYGGEGDDMLVGMGGPDVLLGEAGADTIFGDGSLDFSTAQATAPEEHGDDVLLGGVGNDSLVGQGGNDALYGGDDDDNLEGDGNTSWTPLTTHGNDYLDGGDGSDRLSGYGKDDELFGGHGNDNLWGDASLDVLEGQYHGRDYLHGEDGNDYLEGGGGNDMLEGGEGADTLLGDAPANDLAGEFHGNDTLDGGAGDDTLAGSGGADVLSGGLGNDNLVGDGRQLAAEFHGADTLNGEDGNDLLWGGHGNDVLYGGNGDDQLNGEADDDELFGGHGNDNLWGDASLDVLEGQYHGRDYLHGEDGNDYLEGGGGNDVLEGGEGADTLLGDAPANDLAGEFHGADTLNGEDGNDLLWGGHGNDVLYGGNGNDQLDGEAGDDILVGGAGDDTLLGGPGNDEYRIYAEETEEGVFTDSIGDTVGSDSLVLSGVSIEEIEVNLRSDRKLALEWGAGQTIIVTDGLGSSLADVVASGRTITMARLVGERMFSAVAIASSAGGRTLLGGAENDTLTAAHAGVVVSGGRGADTIHLDSDGGAIVEMHTGDGLDGVSAVRRSTTPGLDATNVLRLGPGVASTDLRFYKTQATGYTLIFNNDDGISFSAGTAGSPVNPADWIFDTVEFADGSTVTWQDVLDQGILTAEAPVGTAGNDDMQGTPLADQVFGLSGNDRIEGFGGADTLNGGAGDDTILGGDGDDFLDGGSGSDQVFGESGNDTLLGGRGATGMSQLSGGEGTDEYRLFTGIGIGAGGRADDASLSSNDSYLVKSIGSSDYSLPQNWTVRDLGGTDTLVFGERWMSPAILRMVRQESDLILSHFLFKIRIEGMVRADGTVDPQLGLEEVRFATGEVLTATQLIAMTLQATARDDVIDGFTGADLIDGAGGNDVLRGNAGDDTLLGGAGYDHLDGGDGNDTLEAGAGGGILYGGNGNDVFIVRAGDGQVRIGWGRGYASEGSDTVLLQAMPGDVSATLEASPVDSEESDIVVRWNDGSATLRLLLEGTAATRSGNAELIHFADGTPLDWAPQLPTATAADDTVILGSLDDVFDGGAGNDVISGHAGNDSLAGGQGDDILWGGDGSDLLVGGAGDDVLHSGSSSNNFQHDTFEGGAGNDLILVDIAQMVTYRFETGFGNDEITFETGYAYGYLSYTGNMGRVAEFGPGIHSEDIRVSRNNNSLILSNAKSTDTIFVQYFFADFELTTAFANALLTGIAFADGTYLDTTAIINRLQPLLTVTDDRYTGSGAAEVLDAMAGNDNVSAGAGNDTVLGGAGDDRLQGDGGDDLLSGGGGNDVLDGGDGNDVFIYRLGDGNDSISGDHYDYSNSNDRLIFGTGILPTNVLVSRWSPFSILPDYSLRLVETGNSISISSIESVMFDDGTVWDAPQLARLARRVYGTESDDTLILTTDYNPIITSAANELYGLSGNDQLTGSDGSDKLDGGTGNDTMAGGAGNDTYFVDSHEDVVTESASAGRDIVVSSVSYTLGTNVENLTLTGNLPLNGTGNSLANVLRGNGTANTLDGGSDSDSMFGGAGNDTYVVDDAGDTVTELADEGTDMVQSSLTWRLPDHVENLTLTGTSAINGTGNAIANILTGNSGSNVLNGDAGNDTLVGGADNDTYVVDSEADFVMEDSEGGTDLVQSAVTWTLGANVENLTLIGAAAINGTGNVLNNTLTGNSAANTLDGGLGNDTMAGGRGNDTYVVNSTEDVVIEAVSAGTDTVMSSVTLILAANVENLSLTGTSAINGTGNTLNNVLRGNAANNTLSGGTGSDSMIGGNGNDTYVVDAAGDTVVELLAEGIDLVQSSVTYALPVNIESLTLTGTTAINGTGNTLDNLLMGNSANNKLYGGAGDDILTGGAGNDHLYGQTGDDKLQGAADGRGENDYLTGGQGQDLFILGTAITSFYDDGSSPLTGSKGYAHIYDFDPSSDSIQLHGDALRYSLEILRSETKIYILGLNSAPPDLIAVLAGQTGLNLSSSYFNYVYHSVETNSGQASFHLMGTLAVGQTLSALLHSSDPDGNGPFAFQWQSSSDGTNWLNLGSEETYTVASSDQGKQLQLAVTYTDDQNFDEFVTVAAGTVPNLPPLDQDLRVVALDTITLTESPLGGLEAIATLNPINPARSLPVIGIDNSSITLGSTADFSSTRVNILAEITSIGAPAVAVGLDRSRLLLRPGNDSLSIESRIATGATDTRTSVAVRNSFVSANRGDDLITLRGDLWGERALIYAGDGNDQITAYGIGRDSFIQAGAGNDLVSLGRLETTPGAAPLDRLNNEPVAPSTYRGGAGFDTLHLREVSQAEFSAEATWFTSPGENGWQFRGARFSGFETYTFG